MILEATAILNKNEITKAELDNIKNNLTLANPQFFKLQQISKPTWATPRNLYYYNETNNTIEMPLGAAQNLVKIVKSKLKIKDNRFLNTHLIDIEFTGKLRNYQKVAKDAIIGKTIGTVQATTGSGKTIIAIAAICERKQPTLFLVHTLELANQFIERLKQFTNIKDKNIGIIGNNKYEIRDVSVGILQTMVRLNEERLNEINNYFGQIFVDETHIVPANTFYRTLCRLKAKYRFGLTATPFRADGLTPVIFFTTGNIIHIIPPEKVQEHLIIPEVEFIFTDYDFPIFDSSEHSLMLTDMARNEERNQLIIKKYKEVGVKRQSVFISHRVEQLEILQKHIPNSEILTSKISKKKRAKIMENLNNKKLKAVLTTYGLFSTGIDVKSLEVVYMCTPIRSPRWVIQTAGRLKRKSKGKTKALVIDFVDKKVEMLKNQYYSRRVTWKKIKNQEI